MAMFQKQQRPVPTFEASPNPTGTRTGMHAPACTMYNVHALATFLVLSESVESLLVYYLCV